MTSVEIVFLGTTAAIPTKHRNHASIYLKYQSENEFSFLFDCGEGTQRQLFAAGLNFMRLNEIFISHWHADHFAGLLGLFETMNLEDRQKQLTIFGPEAEKFVPMLLELGYSTKNFPIVARDVEYEGSSIETLLETDEFVIQAIPARHGIPAVSYAFVEKDRVKIDKAKAMHLGLPEKGPIYKKIKTEGAAAFKGGEVKLEDMAKVEKGKKVVYSGDTMASRNMVKLAENADLLIHDSTFFEGMEKEGYRHASFEEVLRIAKEAHAKEVILTHISRRYQDLKELADKIKPYPHVKMAKDFMRVEVK
ncbi:MAG: ribonuclease Z [Candidatus Aenigmarchaeota archaeon]|nr:ribonuclease Z [Candidatus Aenigmarchaeota archaeon]